MRPEAIVDKSRRNILQYRGESSGGIRAPAEALREAMPHRLRVATPASLLTRLEGRSTREDSSGLSDRENLRGPLRRNPACTDL